MNKKSISSIVSISLLIVVTVVSVIGFQNWYTGYLSDLFVDVETQKVGEKEVKIDSLIGNSLYIYNSQNISIDKLSLSGTDCMNNLELNKGISKINIKGCIINKSGSTEVFVKTNNQTLSKQFYLDKKVSSLNPITDSFENWKNGANGPPDGWINESGVMNRSQLNVSTGSYSLNMAGYGGAIGTNEFYLTGYDTIAINITSISSARFNSLSIGDTTVASSSYNGYIVGDISNYSNKHTVKLHSADGGAAASPISSYLDDFKLSTKKYDSYYTNVEDFENWPNEVNNTPQGWTEKNNTGNLLFNRESSFRDYGNSHSLHITNLSDTEEAAISKQFNMTNYSKLYIDLEVRPNSNVLFGSAPKFSILINDDEKKTIDSLSSSYTFFYYNMPIDISTYSGMNNLTFYIRDGVAANHYLDSLKFS